MDKFLEYYDIPKLIKEVENPNSLVTIAEIFLQGLDSFMGESYQPFMELFCSFTKQETFFSFRKQKKKTLPNSLYESSVAFVPKPDKNSIRKEKLKPVLFMNRYTEVLVS